MDATQRRRGFDALIARTEGNAPAMAALSRLLRTDGLKERAADLAARALALAPDDGEIRAIAGEILSADVPSWHFVIVRDEPRNLAYEEALRRAVTPGSRVLEIGTGTGLLAMMAARAGAAHVFTCEMEPAVALAARDVIARNGLSERITVLSKRSTDVDPAELGALADILVSETVSNDMLAEDTLPSLADAIARLVKPGGRVIPARGRVRVALAHEVRMESRRIGVISGFDLSSFNRLAGPCYQVVVGSPQLQLRSDAADLFHFDFQSGGPWSEQRSRVEVRAHGGPVNGIVQWIALDMDEVGRYENQPGPTATSSWAALFHPFPTAVESRPAQACTIRARHDSTALRIWGKLAD
ncbi:MAG: 50S ribosomal protein L11 methyltransferase [Acidobacteriota bacterium]